MRNLLLGLTLMTSISSFTKEYKVPKVNIDGKGKALMSSEIDADTACTLINDKYSYARNVEYKTEKMGDSLVEYVKIASLSLIDSFRCVQLTAGHQRQCSKPIHLITRSNPSYETTDNKDIFLASVFTFSTDTSEEDYPTYEYISKIECE